MDLATWLRLLATRRFQVSPSKWPLALGATVFAVGNSVLGLAERALCGSRIAATTAPEDPTFIVGHWRTGTTLLHEWLDLDPANRCPTTYECLSPHHFLLTRDLVQRWFRFLLPRRRPMDQMKVSWERPQEDEAALCNLGAESQFLMVAFPGRGPCGGDYVTLEGLDEVARQRWLNRHRRFLRRVLAARPGRLVLKSPQHTLRISRLAAAYPRSRFIYLTRNPYEVYPSTMNFWRSMMDAYGLQRAEAADGYLQEYVLDTFVAMHACWESQAAALPSERLTNCAVRRACRRTRAAPCRHLRSLWLDQL